MKKEYMTRAFQAVASTPWAISTEALDQIIEISNRANAQPEDMVNRLELLAAKTGEKMPETRYTTTRGSVAVLNVVGPIFRYANLMTEFSGAVSLDILTKEFAKAEADDGTRHIVMVYDTPGGQATGISEFAEMIKNSKKPVTAYVDGMAASAGYWLASAASKIYISKTAELGSVGAVLGIDTRESQGVVKIISSQSPLKQASPNTEAGREELQTRIDVLAQIFIDDVAGNRKVAVETVLQDFGRGGIRMGEEAVRLGMADEVSTFEAVVAGLTSGEPNNHRKGAVEMAETKTDPQKPEVTLESIKKDFPAVAEALMNEGAESERARIQAVRGQSLAGHEKLIEGLMFDGKTTGPEAAVKVLDAEKQNRSKGLNSLVDGAEKPLSSPSTDAEAFEDAELEGATVEETAKLRWDKSKELRAEHGGDFDAYLAYCQAMDKGLVRVRGGKK